MRTLLLLLLALPALTPAAEAGTTLRRAFGTFEVSYDPRDCLYPLCGGYWVSPVNHDQMICEDGQPAAQCYVAEIDWDAMGWTAQDVQDFQFAAQGSTVLVRGRLSVESYTGGGSTWRLGMLTPRLAFLSWSPATSPVP